MRTLDITLRALMDQTVAQMTARSLQAAVKRIDQADEDYGKRQAVERLCEEEQAEPLWAAAMACLDERATRRDISQWRLAAWSLGRLGAGELDRLGAALDSARERNAYSLADGLGWAGLP